MNRLRWILLIAAAVIAVPIVGVGWWLLSPIFFDKVVDEEFPFSLDAIVPVDMTQKDVEKVMVESAQTDQPVVKEPMPFKADTTAIVAPSGVAGANIVAFAIPSQPIVVSTPIPNTTAPVKPTPLASLIQTTQATPEPGPVTQPTPEPAIAATPTPIPAVTGTNTALQSAPTPEPTATPAPLPTPAPPTPVPPTAIPTPTLVPAPAVVKLKEGEFRDADSVHRGSGLATIYMGPDGSRVLRLENFNVTNGPDLHVIMSPASNPTSRGGVHSQGYIDLGKLKGNIGNQNYPIPDDLNITNLRSVVIYCSPFHVIFSVAQLADLG
jgi:hypothetical protein